MVMPGGDSADSYKPYELKPPRGIPLPRFVSSVRVVRCFGGDCVGNYDEREMKRLRKSSVVSLL